MKNKVRTTEKLSLKSFKVARFDKAERVKGGCANGGGGKTLPTCRTVV